MCVWANKQKSAFKLYNHKKKYNTKWKLLSREYLVACYLFPDNPVSGYKHSFEKDAGGK